MASSFSSIYPHRLFLKTLENSSGMQLWSSSPNIDTLILLVFRYLSPSLFCAEHCFKRWDSLTVFWPVEVFSTPSLIILNLEERWLSNMLPLTFRLDSSLYFSYLSISSKAWKMIGFSVPPFFSTSKQFHIRVKLLSEWTGPGVPDRDRDRTSASSTFPFPFCL